MTGIVSQEQAQQYLAQGHWDQVTQLERLGRLKRFFQRLKRGQGEVVGNAKKRSGFEHEIPEVGCQGRAASEPVKKCCGESARLRKF